MLTRPPTWTAARGPYLLTIAMEPDSCWVFQGTIAEAATLKVLRRFSGADRLDLMNALEKKLEELFLAESNRALQIELDHRAGQEKRQEVA